MSTSQILGYVGMVLIATSFFFSNIRWLRLLNLFGAIAMAIYGVLINEWPVALLNIIIAVVNVFYLYKMGSVKTRFDLALVQYQKGNVFDKFYKAYKDDIGHFFPEFDLDDDLSTTQIDLVLRDFRVVGCFIYQKHAESITVLMDYVEPSSRDMENSRYLYAVKKTEFKAQGVQQILCKSNVVQHQSYLKRLGFSEKGNGEFQLQL